MCRYSSPAPNSPRLPSQIDASPSRPRSRPSPTSARANTVASGASVPSRMPRCFDQANSPGPTPANWSGSIIPRARSSAIVWLARRQTAVAATATMICMSPNVLSATERTTPGQVHPPRTRAKVATSDRATIQVARDSRRPPGSRHSRHKTG